MGGGLSKAQKNRYGPDAVDRLRQLRKAAKSAGYDLKQTTQALHELSEDHSGIWDSQDNFMNGLIGFGHLQMYRDAMGDTGTYNYPWRFIADPGNYGSTSVSGAVKIDGLYVKSSTYIHEHTHNMVANLITKEMGFARNTPEFHAAWSDGVIEKSIQDNALAAFKRWAIRSKHPDAAKIKTFDVKQAAQYSNMREYAWKQYAWAPTGTYLEVPTVASEMFYKHLNNSTKVSAAWTSLKSDSPYSYYVLQELKKRIK